MLFKIKTIQNKEIQIKNQQPQQIINQTDYTVILQVVLLMRIYRYGNNLFYFQVDYS